MTLKETFGNPQSDLWSRHSHESYKSEKMQALNLDQFFANLLIRADILATGPILSWLQILSLL